MAQHIGTIAWFDNANGHVFLASPGIRDVFCFRGSIPDDGYASLTEGELVEFDVDHGVEGSQAVNVRRLT